MTTVLSESIPKFHFPQGRPQANLNIDSLISKIEKIFSQFPNERATTEEMGQVAKVSIGFLPLRSACYFSLVPLCFRLYTHAFKPLENIICVSDCNN